MFAGITDGPARLVCDGEASVEGCKSLFALLFKNSPGFRCDFRVKMWGTSSPDDKHTGDFANGPDAISISNRGLFGLPAGRAEAGRRVLAGLRRDRGRPCQSGNYFVRLARL